MMMACAYVKSSWVESNRCVLLYECVSRSLEAIVVETDNVTHYTLHTPYPKIKRARDERYEDDMAISKECSHLHQPQLNVKFHLQFSHCTHESQIASSQRTKILHWHIWISKWKSCRGPICVCVCVGDCDEGYRGLPAQRSDTCNLLCLANNVGLVVALTWDYQCE